MQAAVSNTSNCPELCGPCVLCPSRVPRRSREWFVMLPRVVPRMKTGRSCCGIRIVGEHDGEHSGLWVVYVWLGNRKIRACAGFNRELAI